MTKLLKLFVLMITMATVFAIPTSIMAADDVYYDIGDGSKLYITAQVCKIADCITSEDDSVWKDYSTTSENIAGDAGSGDTLVVAPGDTLTFRGGTRLIGVGTTLNPIYGISFTNESYLTIDNVFSTVVNGVDYADVDDDDIYFSLASYDNITLSSALVGGDDPLGQFGAITATVNANVPDGTVITGTFYVSDEGIGGLVFGPQRALAADDYVRSTVRILVSNPAPAQTVAPATTLPTTGNDAKSPLPYLFLLASIAISASTIYIMRRAKK